VGLNSCPQGGTGCNRLTSQAAPGTAIWTNAVHRNFGNALFADGSVEALDNATFQKRVVSGDENQSLHYAPAR
jgi:prepilin-type processing-associated H-X9-DG protein